MKYYNLVPRLFPLFEERAWERGWKYYCFVNIIYLLGYTIIPLSSAEAFKEYEIRRN
jgi:hypothetical protein